MVIGRNRTGKPFEHAFAALCCGGGIREFVLFSATPHVQVRGSFTWAQHSWICVAGSLAEILLFPLMLLAAPRTCSGRLAVEVTGIFAAIELIGWTASALAQMDRAILAAGLCTVGYRMRLSSQS